MAGTWESYAASGQKLDAIVLKTKRLSEQLLKGSQLSYFKSKGILFEEIRKYQAGDDVRAIHWSVTAKLREPYIKLYREERTMTLWLLLDISSSGIFGTRKQTKFDLIIELSAVLGFAAQKCNFKVGAVFFSDKLEKVIFPQESQSNVHKILHFLVNLDGKGRKTELKGALDHILQSAHKGSLVVVLSDFLTDTCAGPIRSVSRQHELLGIRIFDKSEIRFPAAGYMQVIDAETGTKALVNTSAQNFQNRYQAWHLEQETLFKDIFTKGGANFMKIATDESYIEKLRHYFQK